jgi:hypothetical protein
MNYLHGVGFIAIIFILHVITHFWGTPQIHFSLQKKEKKTQNNVVLNGTVLLLPLDVQQGKRRFSPLQRPFLSLS